MELAGFHMRWFLEDVENPAGRYVLEDQRSWHMLALAPEHRMPKQETY